MIEAILSNIENLFRFYLKLTTVLPGSLLRDACAGWRAYWQASPDTRSNTCDFDFIHHFAVNSTCVWVPRGRVSVGRRIVMRAESLMTAFACRRGAWPGFFLALVSAVLAPAAFAADPMPVSATGETVFVHIDQAKTLKLPERTATLVIGNPLIADAVVQPGGLIVITAKSYGATNVIAVDRNGGTLLNRQVQVIGPADRVVVVYRGIDRESYSCMPSCERRITIGDSAAYFTTNLTQIGSFGAQAQGQAPK
jgi:hypothetical protein